MPLILTEQSNNKDLFLWEMSENIDDYQRIIPESLYSDIINNTKLEKRKLEKLSQVMLLQKAKIAYENVLYAANGKPYLTNGKHLSFSHSASISSLLIDKYPCGLDIEYPSEKIHRIASKFIHPKEQELIGRGDNIYWAWSIKEAIFKYFGEKVVFKDHIFINEIRPDQKIAFANYKGKHGSGLFELKLMQIKKYYLAYTKTYRPL